MLKRIFDFWVSLFLLLLISPALILIVIAIAIFLGRPVLFNQTRSGELGKPFTIVKFRSMTDQRDQQGNLEPDELRLTKFGQLLRKASLDEVPELWNVIKGEMSLVGPRPLLMEYIPLYTEAQSHRLTIKPGITGWAQVNGRNALGWEEKFKLDLWYVNNQSFWLDMKILLLTLKQVIARDGISADNDATMPRFKGSR